jgi:hypothetical protein
LNERERLPGAKRSPDMTKIATDIKNATDALFDAFEQAVDAKSSATFTAASDGGTKGCNSCQQQLSHECKGRQDELVATFRLSKAA